MTDYLSDLWRRIINGESINRDDALWSVLLVGMLFATVHLITMLVTRWGDHKATTKSLIFSIAVHLSCGMGLLAMHVPEIPQQQQAKKPPEKKDEPVIEVRFDGVETFATNLAGNTAFNRMPRMKQRAFTRREPLPVNLQPLPEAKRQSRNFEQANVTDPKLPAMPDKPPLLAMRLESGLNAPPVQSILPQKIFDETAPRRQQANTPAPKSERILIPRPKQVEKDVIREVSRGATKQVDDPIRIQRFSLLRNDDRSKPTPLASNMKKTIIRRRVSPAPNVTDASQSGLSARRETKGTGGGNPRPFERIRTQPETGVAKGDIDRYRPTITPKSQNNLPNPILASRNGPLVRSIRNRPQPGVLQPAAPLRTTKRVRDLPATYRLRSLANRKKTAEKFGGTDASEKSVEAALAWLAKHQNEDGYWDADFFGSGQIEKDENGVNRKFAGKHADAGITALALLAFLGAGYTHEEGPYVKTVEKALEWLIAQQRSDGFLGGDATHYAKMYCHAMATYALAEAYGMQNDPTVDTRLRDPLRRALRYTLSVQSDKDGGWRYMKGQVSDMSMFGWQLMSLKSAEIAGLHVPDDAKRGMIQFLKDHSFGQDKGLAAYQKHYPVTATMTAEALFCKQMFNIPRTHKSSKEAVGYMMDRLPKRSALNLYYWYYGTLAMFQYGGPEWKKWNDSVRYALVNSQVKTGRNAGSWDPKGPWGPYGGRVFSTAVSTLCLEVYYRFLPLYKMSGRSDTMR